MPAQRASVRVAEVLCVGGLAIVADSEIGLAVVSERDAANDMQHLGRDWVAMMSNDPSAPTSLDASKRTRWLS
jgi:hypothetical protein